MSVAGKRHEIAIRYGWWERRKRAAAAHMVRRETARTLGAIRKAPMTRAEKAIACRLVGLWMRWRTRGWIDPTLAEIAAHVGCDRRTVQRVWQRLEAAGWWRTVSHAKGGRGVRRRIALDVQRIRECAVRGIGYVRQATNAVSRYRMAMARRWYTSAVTGYQKGRHYRARSQVITPTPHLPSVRHGALGVLTARTAGSCPPRAYRPSLSARAAAACIRRLSSMPPRLGAWASAQTGPCHPLGRGHQHAERGARCGA